MTGVCFVNCLSVAQCCAMCKSTHNCTIWTYSFTGTAAKPLCYGKAGHCCYLKTADAFKVRL